MNENDQIRKYHRDDCITFKSTKGIYGGLSNMAPGFPIKINDFYIRNSEVLYQALRYPDYPDIQKVILGMNSPMSAKQYSRKFIQNTRPDWDENRFRIMRLCVEIKLVQNWSKFSVILKSTENYSIVEYSTEDKIWGACKHGEYYIGVNALGRLLMELREKLRHDMFSLTIPNIDNLTILGIDLKEVLIFQYSNR
ncbi:NADAR family protein [Spirosoma sp. 209]|uniref:NADAR family protein n=1 Tax=Spirosoma sp. 209 TaxID=1955701 RepID=UPI00098D4694|nr:NADAR family protein [Spirosoma sp. 209]